MTTKKKVFYTLLGIFGAIIIVMWLTVPTREDYNDWLAEKYGIIANEKTVINYDYIKDDLELVEMARKTGLRGVFVLIYQELQVEGEANTLYRIESIGVFNHFFTMDTYKHKDTYDTIEDGSLVFSELK